MGIEKGIFQRTQLLLGKSFIEKASEKIINIDFKKTKKA